MKHISLVYFSHSYSRSLWNRYAEGAPHVNNYKIIVRHGLEEVVEVDEYEGVKMHEAGDSDVVKEAEASGKHAYEMYT